MKTNIYTKYVLLLIGLMILFGSSCQKEWGAELQGDVPRLFRPVIKGSLQATGNYIEVAWQKSIETKTFKVELSIDTFNTITNTVEVQDTSGAIIEDLLWEQLYQVRVTAIHSTDPQKNSLPADFGEIKTPRFPTIVESPVSSDAGLNSILFKWRNEGDPVTTIKVVNPENETVFQTIPLTSGDIDNQYILVEELQPATSYTIELYSDERFRGSNTYTTKEPISGDVVDLQNEEPSTVNLSDVVHDAVAGTTIILKRGATYEIGSALNFSKTVTLISGVDPMVTEKAKIHLNGISNFNITANSNIAKIEFNDLELYTNDAGGKYLFNPSGLTANIDELIFNNCIVHDVRGVARFRGNITVGQYTIENSIVYNVGGYAVMCVDDATAKVNNFTFNNSTLYNADLFIVSKNLSSGKVVVSNSTLYNAIQSNNRYFADYNGFAPSEGIEVTNVIFGRAKGSNSATPTYDIFGIRYGGGTLMLNSSNNHGASDFQWRSNSAQMYPEVTIYTKPSTDIFTDPDNANFKIKDNGFPGRENAGDPRWRM